MTEKIRSDALVIRRFEWSETSRVVHLLLPELGRVNALVRGVHRESSPFRGVFDHGHKIELELRYDHRKELQTIDKARLVEHYPGMRRDLGRYYAALYATELADAAMQPGAPSVELYATLVETFEALSMDELDLATIVLAFELRYLDGMGLRPAIDTCSGCGRAPSRKVRPTVYAHPAAGGIVCRTCRAKERTHLTQGWLRLKTECLAWALRLLERGPRLAHELRVPQTCIAGLRRLLDAFVEYHLERRPRARRFLRRASSPSSRC